MLLTLVVVVAIVIVMAKRLSSFADRLGFARELSGMSARGLDRLAGLRAGHTALIEAGRRPNVETRTAEGLARALGLSLDWLVMGVGDMPRAEDVARAVARAERKRTGTDG
jgi:transcriptional regulator with XRE-family HTH domain